MVLSVGAYFGLDDPRLDQIYEMLLRHQLPDGGWNCDVRADGHHSSMNTTVSVVEALAIVADANSARSAPIATVLARAWGFFADHHLYKSHRTGETIDDRWTRFSFPPRWHYDVLRGLDHLAERSAPKDARYRDGIELVEGRRTGSGGWKLQNRHQGKEHFRMEQGGVDSRWNTLRALRVLKWWYGDHDPEQT